MISKLSRWLTAILTSPRTPPSLRFYRQPQSLIRVRIRRRIEYQSNQRRQSSVVIIDTALQTGDCGWHNGRHTGLAQKSRELQSICATRLIETPRTAGSLGIRASCYLVHFHQGDQETRTMVQSLCKTKLFASPLHSLGTKTSILTS